MLMSRFPRLNNGTLHYGMLCVIVAFNAFVTNTLSSSQKSTESFISYDLDIALTCAVSNAICVAKALSADAAAAPGVWTGEAPEVRPGEATGVSPGEAPTPTGATEGFDGATAAANAATKADAVSTGAGAVTGVAARVGPGVAAIIVPGEAEAGAGVGGAGRGSKLSVRQAPVAAVTPDTTVCGVGCAKSDGKAFANAACARSSSDG